MTSRRNAFSTRPSAIRDYDTITLFRFTNLLSKAATVVSLCVGSKESLSTPDSARSRTARWTWEKLWGSSLETAAVGPGETQKGELVLTNLGRLGSPVIRYRTGDLVELSREPCPCGLGTAWLHGGVLGRIDQMVTVRGINVYPSAIDNIVLAHAAVDEYEAHVRTDREMAALILLVEVSGADPGAVAKALEEDVHSRLQLRPHIDVVPAGTLPRYELKSRRFRGITDDGDSRDDSEGGNSSVASEASEAPADPDQGA